MSKLKWSTSDSWAAVHMGFNLFDCDDGTARIQRIDDITAWRSVACDCDKIPPILVGTLRPNRAAPYLFIPCKECKKVGFTTNMVDDALLKPKFDGDEEAAEWVMRNARKNKVCRKAIKITYGI